MDKVVEALITYNGGVIGDIFSKMVYQGFVDWFHGKEEGSFYNHEYYMGKHKDISIKVAKNVFDDIENILAKVKKKEVSNSFLFMLGVLSSSICVGINIKTNKEFLLTKDKNFLDYIHSKGLLDGEIETIKARLDRSLMKDIKSGTFTCMELRLGVDKIKVVGKSGLHIGVDGDIFCFPLASLLAISNFLSSQEGVFRVYENSDNRLKKVVVSFNKNHSVELGYMDINVGYNVRGNFLECYDLESPLHDINIVQLKVMNIEKIEKVTSQDIDTTLHKIDSPLLRKWVFTRINRLNLSDLRNIQLVGIKDFTVMWDKKEVLIKELSKLSTKDLYYFALNNRGVLGDAVEGLEKARKWVAKEFKNFTSVHLPLDELSRIKELKKLLQKGVLRVVYKTLKGKVVTAYATNNRRVLMKIYGEDYVKHLETPSVKIEEVMNKIIEKQLSEDEKLQIISDYGLSTYEIDINHIDRSLIKIKQDLEYEEMSKQKAGYIVYRDLFASYQHEFIKMFHISRVIKVEASILYDEVVT